MKKEGKIPTASHLPLPPDVSGARPLRITKSQWVLTMAQLVGCSFKMADPPSLDLLQLIPPVRRTHPTTEVFYLKHLALQLGWELGIIPTFT